MDIIIDANQIRGLPLSDREANHISRGRIAYHVYLSYYFYLFGRLDDDLKRSVMVDCRLWDDDDDVSVDSTMTPRLPLYYEISKAAAKTWNGMDDETKMVWKQRTIELNSRPPTDGVFRIIPEAINTGIYENVLTSLTQDWSNLVRVMKQSMINMRFSSAQDSQREFKFGKETVRKDNQVYKSFYLNFY